MHFALELRLLMRTANEIINPTTQVVRMNKSNKSSAHALGLNMGVSFSTDSLAIWLVTLYPDQPFISLVTVSVISIGICAVMHIINTVKVSKNR